MNPIRLALLASLALSAACNIDQNDRIPPGPPRLRFVNAAAAASNVTVHLNDSPQSVVTGGLAYRTATDNCSLVFDGTHKISFVQSGNTIASVTAPFAIGTAYTVVLVSNGSTFRALALRDDEIVAAGNNGLRLINATQTAGDVYVTAPGSDPAPATKAAGNVGSLALSTEAPPYVVRSDTDIRIRLYDVGATSTDRADLTLAATLVNRLSTVIFVDRTFGGDPGAFQLLTCPAL
jgi:hypothetical protein